MKALITGSSSGIGRDIALYLHSLGHEVILVDKNKTNLNIGKTITCDLSNEDNCIKLHKEIQNIDILINNAGFGDFGRFDKTSLDKDINMIDTNIKAVHILTKLFLNDFKKQNKGYILNVSSAASFQAGPLMATYYATKAYVTRLTLAINEELKRDNINVNISVLCPGPVNTNFNDTANVKFKIKSLDSKYVSKYAVDMMFKKKTIIIPGTMMKISKILSKILPDKLGTSFNYNIQKRKE